MNVITSLRVAAILAFVANPSFAQAPAPAQPVAQPEVKVVTTMLGANVYGIDGQGGRMGALVGPDGIFLVDAQFPQVTEKIVAAIRQLSPSPIRMLVNTHVHGDHTGGNENFGKMGVLLLSRPLLRKRLIDAKTPAAGVPTLIVDGETSFEMNGETIQLMALPRAHTDGDTAVKFVNADVLMTGDVFRSIGYPNIDRASGGSLNGILDGFDTLIDAAGPNTKVAPGHGDVTNRAAIVNHRDMVIVMRDRIAALIKQGRTLPQIVAAKPTADHDERVGNAAASAERFIGQVYAELTGEK